jgi:NAD-dependent DNA ligase
MNALKDWNQKKALDIFRLSRKTVEVLVKNFKVHAMISIILILCSTSKERLTVGSHALRRIKEFILFKIYSMGIVLVSRAILVSKILF